MIPTTTREQALEDMARELWGLLDGIDRLTQELADKHGGLLCDGLRRSQQAAVRRTAFGHLDKDGKLVLHLPVPEAASPPTPTAETAMLAERAQRQQTLSKALSRLESENRELLAEKMLLTELLHTTTRRLVEPLLHPPAPPLPPLEDTGPLAEHAAPDQARPTRAQQQHQAAGVGPPEDSLRGPAH